MKVGEIMQQESLFGEPKSLPDPRADKAEDHRDWEELLLYSWNCDRSLHFLLHGLRCGGAEVVRTRRSFCLMPGEWDESEWKEIKRDKLSPFREKLTDIFKLAWIGLPLKFLKKQSEGEIA